MIHNSAIVHKTAVIHPTAKIWHWTHIRENVVISENVVIGQGCYIDHDVVIPKGCKIQNHVSVYDGVILEEDVFIGPHVVFINDKYPRAFPNNWTIRHTLVKRGASIGAGAVVCCDITIGEHAMIGAGAVITTNIKPNAVMVGNPATQINSCGDDGYPIGMDDDFDIVDGFNRPVFWKYGEHIREGQYSPLEIFDKRMTWKRVGTGLSPDGLTEMWGEYWMGNDLELLRNAFARYYC